MPEEGTGVKMVKLVDEEEAEVEVLVEASEVGTGSVWVDWLRAKGGV